MTTKTLGQILYEVYEGHGLPYCQLSNDDRERYEIEAQAVADVVKGACAKEADDHADYWIGQDSAQNACRGIAISIRILMP